MGFVDRFERAVGVKCSIYYKDNYNLPRGEFGLIAGDFVVFHGDKILTNSKKQFGIDGARMFKVLENGFQEMKLVESDVFEDKGPSEMEQFIAKFGNRLIDVYSANVINSDKPYYIRDLADDLFFGRTMHNFDVEVGDTIWHKLPDQPFKKQIVGLIDVDE